MRAGDEWWLDCEAAYGPRLAEALLRYRIRVKADIDDRTERTAMVSIRGSEADALACEARGIDLPIGVPYAHRGAGPLRVVRVSTPGFEGIDVLGPTGAIDAIEWPEPDPAGFEHARILAGVPRLGVDVDDSTIPQEAFLERDAVSFTKGCFLGQELVCRIDTRGHVNRFFRGVRLAPDGDAPPAGAEVVAGDKVVGTLTSVALSSPSSAPVSGAEPVGAVALATVRREVVPGSEVTVRWAEGEAGGVVYELPGSADTAGSEPGEGAPGEGPPGDGPAFGSPS